MKDLLAQARAELYEADPDGFTVELVHRPAEFFQAPARSSAPAAS